MIFIIMLKKSYIEISSKKKCNMLLLELVEMCSFVFAHLTWSWDDDLMGKYSFDYFSCVSKNELNSSKYYAYMFISLSQTHICVRSI